MNPGLLTLSTFAAGALAVLGCASLVFDLFVRDRRARRRLQEQVREGLRNRVRQSSLFKNLVEPTNGGAAESRHWGARLRLLLEQSGVHLAPATLGLSSAASGLTICLAGLLGGLPWGVALFAGGLAAAGPLAWVLSKRRQRRARLVERLPEAFDLMSRAVRAGHTLSAALQLVASSAKPPLSEEFAYCCEQQNLGLPQEVTFRDLAQRNGVMELQMLALALLVQRQTGGNPCELLEGLASLTRKRLRLKGKVRALTSEGRMQAVVLSVLPLVALAAMYVLNRSYAEILLDRPRLLLGMFAVQGIGALWIRRIVNFDF